MSAQSGLLHRAAVRLLRTLRVRAGLATLACLGPAAARADDWSPNLTLSTAWHNNAAQATRAGDRVGALQTGAELLANERYELNRADFAHVGFHAAAEWWPRLKALNTGSVGLRAEWRHKFGPAPFGAVVGVQLAGDFVAAGETGRRGTSAGITVSARRRFNDHWRGALTQEFAHLNARYALYDQNRAETTAEIGYDLSERARFTAAGFWRAGEIISYAALPHPELAAVAANALTVGTFGAPRVAYSVDARTWGGRVGAIGAIDESSALLLGYEYQLSEKSRFRFANQIVSLALVHQF